MIEDYELIARTLDEQYQEWLNDASAQAEYHEYLDEVNANIPPYEEAA